MNFDYTLYLVTDRQLMSCDSLTEAVEQAILGGCTMIQLREKELSSLEFYNQAVAVKQVTDKYHIPLIINDRIDIAMAVQATGVHIGQHDLPAAAVRKVIGENMLLGVSASSIAEAIQAQQDGADYLGVGAMFPTGTKTDADSVSMEELQKIRTAVSLPIVVIGGINKGNTGRFKPMGIDGLAVVSAIIAQSDIKYRNILVIEITIYFATKNLIRLCPLAIAILIVESVYSLEKKMTENIRTISQKNTV